MATWLLDRLDTSGKPVPWIEAGTKDNRGQ